MHIKINPSHLANQKVIDLKYAPATSEGKVGFKTDFFLLKPVNSILGNCRLLYDVNNRGNKLALAAFNEARSNNPTTLSDAGNGFLMRRGYSILWCGWNGDVQRGNDRLFVDLPVARDPSLGNDGTITGRIYSEICMDGKGFSAPICWGNTKVYPAANMDHRLSTLTMRRLRSAAAIKIPHDQWAFAKWENGRVIPDPTYVYIKEGFRPGWLYDLVYIGKNPRVSGLGAVAVRDVVSFFRYASQDGARQGNPLAGAIDFAYIFGISQSGRFINHFIYQGFNSDENGRIVFDAAFSHVGGAGKAIFNRRFAQITRHGSHHQENLYPSDIFPFTTVYQEDPITRQRGDWLQHARSSGRLPKIFLTQTSTEYWNRGGSLLHTDVQGERDIDLDSSVRLYYIASGHHLFFTPQEQGINRYPLNTLNYQVLFRSLLVALDRWVATGEEPPASRYPRIADGTLVNLDIYRRAFPRIPGIDLPESFYAPLRLDMGPRWDTEGIADHVPPKIGPVYHTLIPAVDEDGNEIAGVRLPDLQVPLATHVGWNMRAADYGAGGMLARWVGSSWPFAHTWQERRRKGDPRRSILERYPSKDIYIDCITEAALKLQHQRLLLEEDVSKILRAVAQRRLWDNAKEMQ
ncbi:MAG: alpha/beta hydrolase domain-containing protein [Planctomycetota bacterium]